MQLRTFKKMYHAFLLTLTNEVAYKQFFKNYLADS